MAEMETDTPASPTPKKEWDQDETLQFAVDIHTQGYKEGLVAGYMKGEIKNRLIGAVWGAMFAGAAMYLYMAP